VGRSVVKVSVVIPSIGRPIITETIESVLSQTLQDFEVIVVGRNVEWLKEVYPTERLIVIEEEGNQAYCRNVGVEKARGKYIAFVDDDDLWTPDKLKKQVMLHDSGVKFSFTGIRYFTKDEKGEMKTLLTRTKFNGNLQKILLYENIIPTSSVMVNKDVFLEVGGFDKDFVTCEDWDLWLRLVQRLDQDDIGYIPEPLLLYRVHPKQTTSLERYLEGRIRLIEKHNVVRDTRKIRSFHEMEITYLKYILGKANFLDVVLAGMKNVLYPSNIRLILSRVFDERRKIYEAKKGFNV